MSIAYQTKSTHEHEPAEMHTRMSREPEAPDRGECDREGPEDRMSRLTEPPEMGDGRASKIEHEFTHGRSQS